MDDNLGGKFKQAFKIIFKSLFKKLLLIVLPIIIVVVIIAGGKYILNNKDIKKGNKASKNYTNSVTYSTSASGTASVQIDKEAVIDNKLKEEGKSNEEISNMTKEEKIEYLGIRDIDIDNISSAELLWKMYDVFHENLDSAETLEKLINAELVTQFPYIGDNIEKDIINGIVKFKRQISDNNIVIMTYVSEEKFNTYKSNYLSSGSNEDKNKLLSCFTMAELGTIKIAVFEQDGIEITTTDEKLTIKEAQEQFGEKGKYNLSNVSKGSYAGTNYTVSVEEVNYLNMVKQYTMPFEYLWTLTVIAEDNGAFASKLADYCYNSEIVISIYDNITTFIEEDEYTYKRQNKTETVASVKINPDKGINYDQNKSWKDETPKEQCVENTVHYKKTKIKDSKIFGITYANTWIVNFNAEYNSTKQDSNNSEQIKIDTETEYRQVGQTKSYSYNMQTNSKTGDEGLLKNEHVISLLANTDNIINSLEDKEDIKVAITKVEVKNYEREIDISQIHTESSSFTYYSKGKTTSTDNSKNFVDAFNSSSKAKSNILNVSSWLFEALQEEEETANMVDLTKYLLNCATNSNKYGDVEIDFNIFNPGDLQLVGSGYNVKTDTVTGQKIALTKEQLKLAFSSSPFSKQLLGDLDAIYEAQEKYKVNGVFTAAVAIIESSAGTDLSGKYGSGQCSMFSILNGHSFKGYHQAGRNEEINDFAYLIAETSLYFKRGYETVSLVGGGENGTGYYCVPADNWIKNVTAQMTEMLTAAGIETTDYSINSNVVDIARTQIGVPYVWGGATLNKGMDCSGLVVVCYKEALGVTLPHFTGDLAEDAHFEHVNSVAELAPGDIIVMMKASDSSKGHTGIYTGFGTMIHEPGTGKVCEEISIEKFMKSVSDPIIYYCHYKN